MSKSKYQVYNEASLSQKLSFKYPEYAMYAGSDPEISETLATLNILTNPKWKGTKFYVPKTKEVELLIALLNERRKAAFATSERTNEISKMGMQQPKSDQEYNAGDSDEE